MSKYDSIRIEAYKTNMEGSKLGLVIFNFWQRQLSRQRAGCFAIKPSGVPYEALSPQTWLLSILTEIL